MLINNNSSIEKDKIMDYTNYLWAAFLFFATLGLICIHQISEYKLTIKEDIFWIEISGISLSFSIICFSIIPMVISKEFLLHGIIISLLMYFIDCRRSSKNQQTYLFFGKPRFSLVNK